MFLKFRLFLQGNTNKKPPFQYPAPLSPWEIKNGTKNNFSSKIVFKNCFVVTGDKFSISASLRAFFDQEVQKNTALGSLEAGRAHVEVHLQRFGHCSVPWQGGSRPIDPPIKNGPEVLSKG